MNRSIRFLAAGCLLIACSNPSVAQGLGVLVSPTANTNTMVSHTPDSRAWTDPALNHNKLLQQQSSDGKYKLIGQYKVVGNSYLYGEHNKGDFFSKDEKGYNIYLSYNTYNQEVEFYSTANPDQPLVKEPGTLDSFILQQNISVGIINPLKFIYGPLLGVTDKSYYEEIYTGKRFSLYKRYKAELGYSSDNYAQAELRQFDLQYEYYYTDTESKGVKKLKINASSIIKEFKNTKDLSDIVNADALTLNPEDVLRIAFDNLNADIKTPKTF